MAPLGTQALGHVKHSKRGTWAPHAIEGWHIGPAMDSYCCYEIWATETRAPRIVDTVEWFPKHVTMPTASSTDLVLAAAHDLTQALLNPTANSPLAPLTDSEVHQLQVLDQVLLNRVPKEHKATVPLVNQVPTEPTATTPPVEPTRTPTIKFSSDTNFDTHPRRSQRVPSTRRPTVQPTEAQQNHHNKVQLQRQQEAKATSAATRKALRKQQPTSRTIRSQTTRNKRQLRPRRQRRHIAAAIALKGILVHKLQSILSPPTTTIKTGPPLNTPPPQMK